MRYGFLASWVVILASHMARLYLDFKPGLAPYLNPSRAVSSVVEHYNDTVGVVGSNPIPPTIHFEPKIDRFGQSS